MCSFWEELALGKTLRQLLYQNSMNMEDVNVAVTRESVQDSLCCQVPQV